MATLAQNLLALLMAMAVINVISGEVARIFETDALLDDLRRENVTKFNLLHASTLEAVISEDIPLLESIISEATAQDTDIHAVSIRNEQDQVLFKWRIPKGGGGLPAMRLGKPFELEGERFGLLLIEWDMRRTYVHMVKHHGCTGRRGSCDPLCEPLRGYLKA